MGKIRQEKIELHAQGLRRCTKCRCVLPEAEFNKKLSDVFGLQSLCRDCNKNATRAYYADNRDHHRKVIAAWTQSNRSHVREYHKKWYSENRERRLEVAKEWKQSNPELVVHYSAARRARQSGGNRYQVLPKEIIRLRETPCYHCGAEAEHIDHIVPISRGGSHSIGNLGPMCAQCNLSKGAKTYAEFRYGR